MFELLVLIADFDIKMNLKHFCKRVLFSILGAITCWGRDNAYTEVITNAPKTSNFVALSGSHGNVYCAINTDKQLVCWGNPTTHNLITDKPTGSDFVSISGNYDQFCAIRTNGEILCWGYWAGNTPVGNDFVALAVGRSHSCAMRENFDIDCWDNGQVSNTPVLCESGNPFKSNCW